MSYMALTVNVADVERDPISGRKLLNQYEIIDELGRGAHGKVKLGRNLEKNQDVAIKIVDRYSKRRRLGKLGDPEDNVKREVAILKKAIHPNVVALLEVIDDPAKKKVYIILEYVQLGEIPWRRKAGKWTAEVERRRYELESHRPRGARSAGGHSHERLEEAATSSEEGDAWRRSDVSSHHWSLEHGGGSADEMEEMMHMRTPSRNAPRTPWSEGSGGPCTPWDSPARYQNQPTRHPEPLSSDHQDEEVGRDQPSTESLPGPSPSDDGASGTPDNVFGRIPISRGNFISILPPDMDYDPYQEQFSYVPCLTMEQARRAFRDTVLGLEYLHYQRIIHRDIKPANLLWTSDHQVKISDFGVSYLGRPIRDDDAGEDLSEADARPLDEAVELAKTVGTPAFYAPELCYTDLSKPRPPVTAQIDLWALGVTLYCLVFARLPFFAEDEYSLFKSIADDDAYIPRRRLKAVEPLPKFSQSSRTGASSDSGDDYRLDRELIYEDIEDDLYDLLKRILEKDPTKRITLKEVKRHPFTLKGIADPFRWIEETDPARKYDGKQIEVSNEDMEKAVVPIGFLARVKSGMRRMGAAIGLGTPRSGRKRAKSTAHSTDGASSDTSTSPTPTIKDERRTSLRGDELIAWAHGSHGSQRFSREAEHPLSQSQTVNPEPSIDEDLFGKDQSLVGSTDDFQALQSSQAQLERLRRPSRLERTVSTSGASMMTIRASNFRRDESSTASQTSSLSLDYPTTIEHGGSPNVLGVFQGASRRDSSIYGSSANEEDAKHTLSERRTPAIDCARNPLDDPYSEPSVAVSNASATGLVDSHPHSHEKSPFDSVFESGIMRPPPVPHRASPISFQRQPDNSSGPRRHSIAPASPFLRSTTPAFNERDSVVHEAQASRSPKATAEPRAQEQMPWRTRTDPERPRWLMYSLHGPHTGSSRSRPESSDEGAHSHKPDTEARRIEWEQQGKAGVIGTNNPYVVAAPSISSSSEDHFTSGMSQSTSHPSIPSMISAGSSFSVDDPALHLPKPGLISPPRPALPSKTPTFPSGVKHLAMLESDEDAGYNGDTAIDSDENDVESDGEDFLVMNRHKARILGSVRSQSISEAELIRRNIRRETGASLKTDRSGSNGTLRKTPTDEEDWRKKGLS